MVQYENIRDKIKEHDAASKSKALKYEKAECWSYAYLSRWVVLEDGLKSLFDQHNKELIRKGAMEWLEYLDGKSKKAPNKITSFSLQTQTIQTPKFITETLGACKFITDALNSTGKFRTKRNRIAHKAEEFQSESKYCEHKEAVDKAIKQLITILSKKINEKKSTK